MALQKFDQLNNMSSKWYSKMDIPEKEKKRRIDLSLLYAEVVVVFFDLLVANELEKAEYERFLRERLRAVAEKYTDRDNVAYINDWSRKEAENIVDVTIRHKDDNDPKKFIEFEEFGIRLPEEEYWTSEERGLLVGIECATTTANFDDMSKAVDKGYTRKTWLTEADDRVRPTHNAVHGTELPINEYFIVGNSYLLFPGDMSQNPEDKEICNCRCWVTYF